MQAFVENLLLHIDDLSPLLVYGFFFLSGFLQIVFPPYPGDSVLVFGGCLGGAGGTAWAALLGYLTATIATSLALFELGYRLNRRIFSVPFIARIMPLEKRGEVENKYKKFGVGLLAVCKFIPGVNTLVVLLGGVLHYPRALGMGAITVSSVLHNLVFFLCRPYPGPQPGSHRPVFEGLYAGRAVGHRSVCGGRFGVLDNSEKKKEEPT